MPDASMDDTLNALVAAGFGAAGHRCMSLSTAVFVGGSMAWEQELVERAKALRVNAGTDPSADIGPVISKEVKGHIDRLIQSGVDSGAKLLLDGRYIVVPGYEKGSFVGPSILCNVTISMDCYKEEIFGPVLLCMQADSLEEAITIVNRNRYRNGASIFTTSGVAARKFQNDIDARLVGVNVPVPLPVSFSASNDPKASFAGDLNFCGKASLQFYTQMKTVAQQWGGLPSLGVSLSMVTSLDLEASRGVSSAPQPRRDSPNERVSPEVSLHEDLPNSGISSMADIVDEDLPNQGVSMVLSSISKQNFPYQEISLAANRDSTSQEMSRAIPQTTESMYIPQTSKWNENLPRISQRTESISSSSRRNYMSTSQRNDDFGLLSKRTDAAMALTSKGIHASSSHESDNMGPISDTTVHPASERLYDMMSTSHLNDTMSQTLQRIDTLFPSSERRYIPTTAHGDDHMVSTSRRPDVASHPTSERIYFAGTSRINDYMVQASQQADAMPTSSEAIYIPPIQRNNSATISERLYMPLTAQRMYTENSIIPIDDFPSQGLPTSQRI